MCSMKFCLFISIYLYIYSLVLYSNIVSPSFCFNINDWTYWADSKNWRGQSIQVKNMLKPGGNICCVCDTSSNGLALWSMTLCAWCHSHFDAHYGFWASFLVGCLRTPQKGPRAFQWNAGGLKVSLHTKSCQGQQLTVHSYRCYAMNDEVNPRACQSWLTRA